MTARLAAALEAHRNLRTRILLKDDGSGVDWHWAREKMATAQRRAVMVADGKLHKLRHTFGARLAMAGAPAKTIQELMGHQDLQTTMRYLHLTPQHKEAAIRLHSSVETSWRRSPLHGPTRKPDKRRPRNPDEIPRPRW